MLTAGVLFTLVGLARGVRRSRRPADLRLAALPHHAGCSPGAYTYLLSRNLRPALLSSYAHRQPRSSGAAWGAAGGQRRYQWVRAFGNERHRDRRDARRRGKTRVSS